MRHPILITLFLLLSTTFVFAQTRNTPAHNITFILYAPELPDSSKVYITGNQEQLGSWNPGKVILKNQGRHTWQIQLILPADQLIEYKYTLGSWDREATDTKGLPLPNFNIKVSSDTLIKNEVRRWKASTDKKTFAGGVTGVLKYHKDLTWNNLPKRDLVVWLPPGYEENKNKRYPVLYMHDGQNIFDPATSSFGVDWQLDETCDSLIRAKVIEPVIVVGIYNTSNRMEEYIPGEKGNAYMQFIVNQVKPLIDKTYRTKPSRKHTLVGGSSAGGIISFMLAWKYPKIFSKAICMSPAFKIQHIDYVDDVLAYRGKKKKLYFYIDNGGIDLEEKLQPGIDEMLAALKQKGYKEGNDFTWIKAPEDKHFEAAWAKRMPKALILALPLRK
ncbi:histidine kinase [Pontibacter sp. KCTC 32443]|uniref:alpha/beta hydrolase-fold protein n=1 Tax=Pontibacter TaxID=323449 RepID=UPI00164D119B|nr:MULTISPECIES: alpha/beta hydrolase-fold protein [Pontibacter]MBC5772753.1 histidine kinase [Pontibacter sp. KCTC 32443]